MDWLQHHLPELAMSAAMAWGAGLRLYLVVFVVGLLGKFGYVPLPETLKLLTSPLVIGAAGFMSFIEFFADKIPWLDSVWDAIHTFLRIPAGAALAAVAHRVEEAAHVEGGDRQVGGVWRRQFAGRGRARVRVVPLRGVRWLEDPTGAAEAHEGEADEGREHAVLAVSRLAVPQQRIELRLLLRGEHGHQACIELLHHRVQRVENGAAIAGQADGHVASVVGARRANGQALVHQQRHGARGAGGLDARALREFPELNARVLDDAYVKLRDVNLGIAVDTPDGLVVPVIRNADELTVRGLARAVSDTAARARDGKLTPDDLAGKTFSVTNPGLKGNLVGGAIISQPNVGILRLGTIKKRVVVVERDDQDLMAIHPVMYMALTYDHRIVDGVHANGFLYRISEILEQGDFEL